MYYCLFFRTKIRVLNIALQWNTRRYQLKIETGLRITSI